MKSFLDDLRDFRKFENNTLNGDPFLVLKIIDYIVNMYVGCVYSC